MLRAALNTRRPVRERRLFASDFPLVGGSLRVFVVPTRGRYEEKRSFYHKVPR
jgi:hypothetical protein